MTERRYRTRRVAALERAGSTSSETGSVLSTLDTTTSQASSHLVVDEHSSPLPEHTEAFSSCYTEVENSSFVHPGQESRYDVD